MYAVKKHHCQLQLPPRLRNHYRHDRFGALSARNHLTETNRSAADSTSPRRAHGRSALTAADSQGHCQHNYLERCWLLQQRNTKHVGFQKEAADVFKTCLTLKHIPWSGDGPAGNAQRRCADVGCPQGHNSPQVSTSSWLLWPLLVKQPAPRFWGMRVCSRAPIFSPDPLTSPHLTHVAVKVRM